MMGLSVDSLVGGDIPHLNKPLELEVGTYILPNHKDLVTLKNPPGNQPDISIESSKYEEAS